MRGVTPTEAKKSSLLDYSVAALRSAISNNSSWPLFAPIIDFTEYLQRFGDGNCATI